MTVAMKLKGRVNPTLLSIF